MSQASSYLDVLTREIGPRPSSSDTERQAAEWLQDKFTESGVPAEMHEFEAARSPQSARTLTYVVAPIAVFGIGASFLEQMWVIHWTCWILLAVLSALTILDLFFPKAPAGLVPLLPKGPSQNVIAKSVPSSYSPGETPKKVVLVANYDSALTSPLQSESMIGIHRLFQTIANTVVMLMPLLVLLILLNINFISAISEWIFYALLVLCAPGAIIAINQIIARAMGRYSPGANNNASGVAAMLIAAEMLTEAQQGNAGASAVKLAAAEAKAAKLAMQSSKMPGIDYAPAPKVAARPAPTIEPAPPAISDFDATADIPAVGDDSSNYDSSEDFSREIDNVAFSDTGEISLAGVDVEESDELAESAQDYGQTQDVPQIDSLDSPDEFAQIGPKSDFHMSDQIDAQISALANSVGDLDASKTSIISDETDAFESVSAGEEQFDDFETADLEKVEETGPIHESRSTYADLEDYDAQTTFSDESTPALGEDTLDVGIIGEPIDDGNDFDREPMQAPVVDARRGGKSKKSSRSGSAPRAKTGRPKKAKAPFFSFSKKRAASSHDEDMSDWLGLEQDFNARKDGKAIGSWDNFGENAAEAESIPPDSGVLDLTDSFAPMGGVGGQEDDGFDWKGGFAGEDPIEDGDYASTEAARIRKKVLESLDLELKEKEIWFVATGAHYAERAGIRAFLDDYSDQLRGALFINISAVGAGELNWSIKESFGRNLQSSARLTSILRRLSRESRTIIRPWKKKAIVSDAGPILAAGRKAVTITRLDDKGIPFAFASTQDTAARLDSRKIDEAAEVVCSIIREV